MDEMYREIVSAIIVNRDKKVLMCEHAWIDDAWQFPQGGVEEGESEEDALMRELYEEIGTDKFKILEKSDSKVKYHLPYYLRDKYGIDGQEQRFFLLYFYGSDDEIRFDNQEKPEFKNFEWVDYDEPPIRVIYFKKLSYLRALNMFRGKVEELSPQDLETELSAEKQN